MLSAADGAVPATLLFGVTRSHDPCGRLIARVSTPSGETASRRWFCPSDTTSSPREVNAMPVGTAGSSSAPADGSAMVRFNSTARGSST